MIWIWEAGHDYTSGKDDGKSPFALHTRNVKKQLTSIEEAIDSAPSVKLGMLQAQVLKYLLRLWLKDNPRQDAEKAQLVSQSS